MSATISRQSMRAFLAELEHKGELVAIAQPVELDFEIAACLAWTGDVVQLKADNPDLGYALPDTGHMIWSDNFVIPNQAQHKKNAEVLINYYYDPKVMAQVADYVNYIPPVKGTKEALTADDPEVAALLELGEKRAHRLSGHLFAHHFAPSDASSALTA